MSNYKPIKIMKKFNLQTTVESAVIPVITYLLPILTKYINKMDMNIIYSFYPIIIFILSYWLITQYKNAREKRDNEIRNIKKMVEKEQYYTKEILTAMNNHADCLDTKVSIEWKQVEGRALNVKVPHVEPQKIDVAKFDSDFLN